MCLQVIAMAMDVFTDVDIFKEIITATLRGVAVYVLLDESHFSSFLDMSRKAGINIQDLKVRDVGASAPACAKSSKNVEITLTNIINITTGPQAQTEHTVCRRSGPLPCLQLLVMETKH